jgi:hypothetical protein
VSVQARLNLSFDITVGGNEAGETVITLDGTKIEGTGKTWEQALDNLKATMLSRLSALRRLPME